MADFKLSTETGTLTLDASGTEITGINNIIMSLAVKKGSWWFNPTFGSELHTLARAKATDSTAQLVKTYVQSALKWLISSGKLTSVTVITEIIPSSGSAQRGRINYLVTAIAPAGNELSYSNFVEVA